MDTIPLQSCDYSWALLDISSVAVHTRMGGLEISNDCSQPVLGARASWRRWQDWCWQSPCYLSLETCNCFLAHAQENQCWLSFLVPFSCVLPPDTLWHHTQRSWLADSIVPYYEMSPDLVQTSPHCWWPSWLSVLLGNGLCWRPE